LGTIEIVAGISYLAAMAAAPDHKTCFKCDYEADTAETRCPRCGKVLRSSRNLRIRGGILVCTGAFLILFMGGIAGFVGYLIWGGGAPGAAAKFHGEEVKILAIFGLFGLVMLIGGVSLLTGLYQLIYGRRSQVMVWVMMFLVVVLVVAGATVTTFLN
jgi:hypothetical protein